VFDFDPGVLRDAAAILLVVFGLLMIWPAPFEWLSIRLAGLTQQNATPRDRQGLLGGFILGTTLGLVWTPCAGPVLGSILTVIATSKDTAWASLLLVIYAIGAAIPMLIIAYGGQAITTRVRSLRPHRAKTAARLRRDRDRLRCCNLLSIRHARRGVADPVLSQWPDRPVTLKEISMRRLITTLPAIALALRHVHCSRPQR
jgi:hypothetical protein